MIVNMGSCSSYVATPQLTQYTTSKHAVLGLTRNAGTLIHFGSVMDKRPWDKSKPSVWIHHLPA